MPIKLGLDLGTSNQEHATAAAKIIEIRAHIEAFEPQRTSMHDELAGAITQLDTLQSLARRLENRPPHAASSLLQEARELRALFAPEGPNTLQERLRRVLREFQAVSTGPAALA